MSCGVHAAVLFALLLLHSVDAFQHVSFQRLARCRGDGALGLCACDGDTNPKKTGKKFVQTLRDNFYLRNPAMNSEFAWESPVRLGWSEQWSISEERCFDLEEGFKNDLTKDPSDVDSMCAYAVFLALARSDYDQSSQLLMDALVVDPEKARDGAMRLWAMIERDREKQKQAALQPQPSPQPSQPTREAPSESRPYPFRLGSQDPFRGTSGSSPLPGMERR